MIDSVNSAVKSTPQKVTSRTTNPTNSVEQGRSDEQTSGVLSHADKLDISGNLSLVQRRFNAAKMSTHDSHNAVAQANHDLEKISTSLAYMKELADQGSRVLNPNNRAEMQQDFEKHQSRIEERLQGMPDTQQMVVSGHPEISESDLRSSDLEIRVGSISSEAEAKEAKEAIESAIDQVESRKLAIDRLSIQLNALTTRLAVASENVAAAEATPEDVHRLEESNPKRSEVSSSEQSYDHQVTQQIDQQVKSDVEGAISTQANVQTDKAQELLIEE